jgi:hypothetical protein
MKIAIAGYSGLIGRHLISALQKRGDEVILIKHKNDKLQLDKEHESVDCVINLSGFPIMGRWTEETKLKIHDSRVNTAKQINHFYDTIAKKPKVFISASAIGYYGSDPQTTMIEDSPMGDGFLASVCDDWETATLDSPISRIVIFRLGVVLAKDGGFYPNIKKMVKSYLGVIFGSGRQMMSWVHIDDVIQAFLMAIDRSSMKGFYNLCAENPIRQKDMMKEIGALLKKPVFLRLPKFLLKILLGEASEFVLADMKAYPKNLKKSDFCFYFDDFKSAIESLE